MGKLHAIALGAALAVSSVVPAFATPSVGDEINGALPPEDVLGEQVRREYDSQPVDVKLDMLTALLGRGALVREMGRVPTREGEAVLGEQVSADEVTDQTLQDMIAALRARDGLDDGMGTLPRAE